MPDVSTSDPTPPAPAVASGATTSSAEVSGANPGVAPTPVAGTPGAAVTGGDIRTGSSGPRFAFGHNWARFLARLDDRRIAEAERSLTEKLGPLDGRTLLDVGSGSGLFSLAAYRLGAARVHSFDYDEQSVACTRALKQRFAPDDARWSVEPGSALDAAYLESLGTFDIVYAWGVLHHTGDLWRALDLVEHRVGASGRLFLSIYNDQQTRSRLWHAVKRLYCSGFFGRALVLATFIPGFALHDLLADLVRFRNPTRRHREYYRRRGMSRWYDWIDWLGGYPFEVARPEAIFEFYRDRGFELQHLKTTNSLGTNEFVFVRRAGSGGQPRPQAMPQAATATNVAPHSS